MTDVPSQFDRVPHLATRRSAPIAEQGRWRASGWTTPTRVALFRSPDLLGLGALADARESRAARRPSSRSPPTSTSIRRTSASCARRACSAAYARLPKEEGAYRYTLEQVLAEAEHGARTG